MFKPALNITEQIADHLGDQIIVGEMGSGTRIQEVKIAKALKVSRGSVREALLILERRHLITIVPRKGASVNELERADGVELIKLLTSLQTQLLAYVLTHRHRREILCQAEHAVVGMEDAARLDDIGLALKQHRAFYATLLSGAGNYMAGVFEGLLPSSQRLLHKIILATDLDLYDFSRFHRALQTALEKLDEERVVELIEAFGRRALSLIEPTFSSGPKSRLAVSNVRTLGNAKAAVH